MAFEHPAAVIGWARLRPNLWDFVAFALVFGVLILLAQAGRETLAPLASVQETPISLDPAMLPE
jgi:NitT/TauT family transport system permease protein